jgi:hypothetical protein
MKNSLINDKKNLVYLQFVDFCTYRSLQAVRYDAKRIVSND